MATNLSRRLEELSPEKRALLLEKLRLQAQAKARAAAAESAESSQGVEWQPIPRRADPASYPLSFAQQRLWILSQLEPESPFYNIPLALHLTGPLDVAALERALNEIIARHEVLRARFVTEHGNPIQLIAPELRLSLRPEATPGPDVEATAREIAAEEARRPFDLATGPLIRCRLLMLSDAPERPQYLALLTFHHIVTDGWSTGVFVRELALLYQAYTTGTEAPLGPLELQYADYAAWQREQLQGERLHAHLAYWREQLSGIPPMLELPTDRPRSAVQTVNGAVFRFELPAELSARLRKLAQAEGATLYQVLLAAYQVLLHRYSNQDDICVGTPIANRTRQEIEGLIGFFVNTLVMRSTFGDDPNFREVLSRQKERALSAQSHQDVPFEMLVDEVAPQRNMATSPIFQVMFALEHRASEQREQDLSARHAQSAQAEQGVLHGLTITPVETHSGTAKFDMTLYMIEQASGPLRGAIEYNTDLWYTSTIERMAGHYQRLLEGIVNNPDLPVGLLPLLSKTEEWQLIHEWNDTATDYPRDRCLHELFEEQVRLRPNAPAVTYGDVTLTYAELNREANRLAHWLQELGVGPEVLVGVYLERGVDLITALLGIIKAGGAYLPLDMEYPPERLAFMLADGRARVLITHSNLEERLPQGDDGACRSLPEMAVIRIDRDRDHMARHNAENPHVTARASNLAYVIYTSGSTGIPKGVSIPQRAISRLVFNTNYINLGPDDRIAQASNASFDAATFEIWGALLRGGELIGVDKELALAPKAFAAFLRQREINTLFLTTALFNLIAAEEPTAFNTLNCVMFGGEAVDPRWVRRILEYGGPSRLLHVYGPTESTTFASWHPIREVAANAATVPIGRPLSNTQIYVLDRHFRPTPIGVSGELCIGGDGLATGYLNRPELTAEKFVPNPLNGRVADGSAGSPRLYRTGDLVRRLPDGSIEFQGRIDHQVKVRGFRIELGEIEAMLREHDQVQQAFVMVRGDSASQDAAGMDRVRSSDRKIVAYIVPKNGGVAPTVADLRAHLKQHLPDYMAPAAFVFLDSLPINPNGKVDRNKLPRPEYAAIEAERPYVAPRTPVERFLVQKWQEVLGIDPAVSRISVTDNFFELGGNSLQAAVLTNRMQEELGASAHVRALFMAPTIADLANYLDEYYPDAVARIAGIVSPEPAAPAGTRAPEAAAGGSAAATAAGYTFQEKARVAAQVDEAKVAQFREIVPPLRERADTPEERADRNPPAVFVLSPPRSGSTLLRVMLAGNPRLFAPPELDLMSFNTLAERRAAFSGRFKFWLEGPIKAIMELRKCSADEAEAIMARFEREGWTTKQFYRQLQQWINDVPPGGPAPSAPRLLVDKTPVYPMDYNILARMEQDFADARYIHLVRHPFATTYSFMEAKLEEIFFRWEHPWTMRELAELVYLVSHRNILKFLEQIPPERQHRVWFEEMVGDAPPVMLGICDFLEIEFHPDMLEPYKGDKMTSGIRPGHQMVGDFKFYLRNKIDPKAADRWKRFKKGDRLADETWAVAREFNYEPPTDEEGEGGETERNGLSPLERTPIQRRNEGEPQVLSYAQERLWFLDQFERPGDDQDGAEGAAGAFYNVPAAVRLIGNLDVAALRASLTAIVRRHEVLRTTFRSVNGVASAAVSDQADIELPVVDLTGLPRNEREAEAMRLAADEARRPFNLATGPLLRATLLDLGSGPEGHETVALITMHHIVSDGWSVNVFIRELAALYAAFVWQRNQEDGPEKPDHAGEGILQPLPIQYSDFAAWQRKWFAGLDEHKGDGNSPLQKQLAYWVEHLRGLPPMLELPTDRPRPPVQTLNGERFTFELPEDLTAKVRALARSEGVTVFMALLAAFQTLLMRYTGQEDIAVGTPTAGRNRPEIENLIGFFVNTLVMRGDLSTAPGQPPLTFRQLLKRTQATAIKAYENQDVPFETLVEALQPQRDMSHTPLFQVMFALQDAPLQTLRAPGLTISPLQPDTKTAKFDLMLNVAERTEQMRCALEYNTDLFNASTAIRMADHLLVLLEAVVSEPDAPVASLPMLTAAERQMMFVDWNDTAVDVETDTTLAAQFEAQARLTPDRLAVVIETGGRTGSLTYGELDERASRIAARLAALGVGPESIVGLMAERSLDLLVGVVGVWKAGAAYVPLDPSYPADRLAYMLTDSGARVLVTQSKLVKAEAAMSVGLVLLDAENLPVAEMVVRRAAPDNIAYVIYTSGSTGKPKGVAVTHRTALNLAAALHREVYSAIEADRPLRASLNAPLSFDASVQQLVMLTLGHTLVVIPQDVRTDAAALLAFIRRQRLDQLDCVPSQLKLVLAEGLLASDAEWTPSIVFPGGEAVDEPTWAVLAGAPRTLFYNMYGPTECTVDSTTICARQAPKRPTIGRPLANVRVYVLDRNLQPVPVGAPGELFITGAGVSRGYLNRPELTAERFLPDPFAPHGQTGARMYRTGDRVRWLPDGTLEFLGRVDSQVKVRGFRIELGEIEETLRSHPAIQEAVVLVESRRASDETANRLVGYVVPKAEVGEGQPVQMWTKTSDLSTADLRRHLLGSLPEYMVPSVFMVLEAMPLTPNGKIDRKALLKLAPEEVVRTETGLDYLAPSSPVERTLAEIFARVLGLEKVGVNDNFFELGGDSILTIQVVARAGQAGINLTPKQVFQSPTVRQLAAELALAAAVAPDNSRVHGGALDEQGEVEGDVPLTPIQRRFFGIGLERPDHWNQSLLVAVRTRLKPDALRAAVAAVVRHHDALRLRFQQVDGEWGQTNEGDSGEVPFEYVNLADLDEPGRAEGLREHTLRLQESLNISRGPLLRVAYFDFGPEAPGRLLTIVHHLAVDRVSWRILLEDLASAYEQASEGQEIHLPRKTASFRDWARRLEAYAQSPLVAAEADYWLRLTKEPIPALVLDRPSGRNLERDAHTASVFLEEGETEALVQQIGKAYGTDVNEALLAALALAFERWSGQPGIFVEVEGHGRQQELVSPPSGSGRTALNLGRTVGWFTNVYPLLLRTGAGGATGANAQPKVGQVLTAVKEQVRATPNAGFGYGLLRYLCQNEAVRTAISALPQPEVSFNYLGQFIQDTTAGAQTTGGIFGPAPENSGPDHAAQNERQYALDVTASVFAGRLRVEFTYSDAQFAGETIETLGEFYIEALRNLIEHCLSPDAGGYTPSDFADAGLSEEGVQDLLIELGEIDG